MDIISSAKSTKLSSFPQFETKATHEHVDNESSDFQLFASRKVIVEVKKNGLELLRIKNSQNKGFEISSVRRLKIPDLYCVACPKQEKEHVALGLSTGQIRLLDYKTSEIVVKFPVDGQRNSALFLDFNASDEYLSGVFENGNIKIYGLKTKTKLESLEFDSSCTLARFHPTKRFHLSTASYKGSVFTYDMQSKKRIFQAVECHCAPCRDICMSAVAPDLMLSVGYDCVVNIFDTRRKGLSQKIKDSHPLSTVAMSDCANYLCAGNLKGDLVSYDLRNIKEALSVQRVHESSVARIAFVPPNEEKTNELNSLEMQSITETRNIPQANKEVSRRITRDSFCDFLDINSFKVHDKKSLRMSSHRDSFDMNILQRKFWDVPEGSPSPHNSRTESPKKLSKSRNKSISFEDLVHGTQTKAVTFKFTNSVEDLPAINVSADKVMKHNISTVSEEPEGAQSESTYAKRNSLTKLEESNTIANTNEILKEIQKLRKEMNQKFEKLELDQKLHKLQSEINFNAERNKWELFTQNAHLSENYIDSVEEIRKLLECVLETEPFVKQFLMLQTENAHLKSQLERFRENGGI